MKWSETGAQIPIEGAKGNQTQTTLNNVLKVSKNGMDEAFNTLLKTPMGIAGRAAGKALDYGETGQAYADIAMSVRGAVYALSGKQVTNKEFEGFLDKFMPKYGDSADRISMKKKRLDTFISSLETKTSKGVLTGEDAVFSAMADTSGAEKPKAMPSGKYVYDPATGTMRPK
jgi:hypothetical protein